MDPGTTGHGPESCARDQAAAQGWQPGGCFDLERAGGDRRETGWGVRAVSRHQRAETGGSLELGAAADRGKGEFPRRLAAILRDHPQHCGGVDVCPELLRCTLRRPEPTVELSLFCR